MRKVLITLASILAVAGIILLNALTFSGRYARMMETSITVTSADDSFIGKKMKEFFAREELEEKLAHEMESLPLSLIIRNTMKSWLVSLSLWEGRPLWSRSAAREDTTTADIASAFPFPLTRGLCGKTAFGKASLKDVWPP